VRVPFDKKEKDIQAVRELLKHINKDRLHRIYDELPGKSKNIISEVCKVNFIDL
jgi:hypothetical protein